LNLWNWDGLCRFFETNTPFIFLMQGGLLFNFFFLRNLAYVCLVEVLPLQTVLISAICVWLHRVLRKKICESVIAKERRNLPEFEQVLEHVLC
jgi:hypothetical protein